ncbi:helix-turn-helix domain-containing protein [Duganella sp. FT92W]|uniref:Helix-turn-helix domain-containing protein n=1 Tax=Pseudoduganella rivuli TaxID=2666085 RepID=A0A7X2LU45_9BURK|nr:helix-turn-helix transcriptional regulator [Pseudoduganella rivuli]MRV72647.1 helix-turn-helix domain-containing protein [Pseudoduganella rivuli]
MQEFYKKALIALLCLVVANALLAWFFIHQSFPTLTLLPAEKDGVRWHYDTYTDVATGGASTIRLHDASRERLRYHFRLSDKSEFPFVSAQLEMESAKGKQGVVDWSKYHTITFVAKCAPAGSMTFVVNTFDDQVTKPGYYATYRSPGTYFSCNEQGVPVSLDLARLYIPDWWFYQMKLDLSHQGYKLDKVARLVFGTSPTNPRNVDSYFEVGEVTLHGRDYRYISALVIIILSSWAAFGAWFFLAHTRALMASLDSKMKKDLPLVAYRQLTLEPYKDKEKANVLRYIATNYTNTELDLECVVNETGANRNKVNDVLKTELGMTFTSYLNKLRLTEAARLLSEKNSAAVAEIAYSVGYGNVSYFNKLFKEEYGCTPKAFRSLASQQEQHAGSLPSEAPAVPADTA